MALPERKLRSLHLFAGAGGGILADLILGHIPVCAVENAPYPRSVLLARQRDGILPAFPVWDDVCTFDGKPWRGRVDIVSGGFPCQDISGAGKGAGIDGERSGLWVEQARIIGEIQPRFAFVENSPMLTVRGLSRVLGDLAEMGYDARWGVLGADAAGFPHHRARFWLVAHAQRDNIERESRNGQTRRVGREWKSVAQDTNWENLLSELRGGGNGIPDRLDRTNSIRNAQVPAVAALAWRILSDQ